MAELVFIILPEEGHLIASFKMARSLKCRGHRVRFLAIEKHRDYIEAQGLECAPDLEQFWQIVSTSKSSDDKTLALQEGNSFVIETRAEIAALIASLSADLLVIDGYLPAISFVAAELGIASVLLHMTLDAGLSRVLLEKSLGEQATSPRLTASQWRVPEIVLCPRELDFPSALEGGRNRYYVEACVDLDRKEKAFDWDALDSTLPLIFCSLGSQAHFFNRGRNFYEAIIDAMRARADLQMVISLGKHLKAEEFNPVPANVKLVSWAPQLEILKRASLMITHGGLGTVKECILLGVPMIVFPLVRNQPLSAARVVYHGLGVRGDAKSVTSEMVLRLIEQVESEDGYAKRVGQMSERFKQMEQEQKGLKIIEKIISILERKKAQAVLCAGN